MSWINLSVLFCFRYFVGPNTGYYNELSVLVLHPHATSSYYLHTNFVLDLLGCLPYEVILIAIYREFSCESDHVCIVSENLYSTSYSTCYSVAFLAWQPRANTKVEQQRDGKCGTPTKIFLWIEGGHSTLKDPRWQRHSVGPYLSFLGN